MPASGTFGSGQEYSGFIDLNRLGAVVTKGVSLVPWEGNPTPRIMETASGMINAVGLQNPGIEVFIRRDLPFLRQFDTKVIVNVCGSTVADYLGAVERLSVQGIDMLEINISCPNVEHGGIAFGQEPGMVEYITKEIKKESGAARFHEADAECHGHNGDCESGRGRGSGCALADQYHHGHEDRREKKDVQRGE